MNLLLSALSSLPEYRALLAAVEAGQAAAVSGVGQLARSHVTAALIRDSQRPALVVCQDDMAAQRMQAELSAFLGQQIPILPGREFTFYDAAVVSRGWEQKRLRQLYDLAEGKTRLLIASLDALSLRTMPRATLFTAAIRLRRGASYDLEDLANKYEEFRAVGCEVYAVSTEEFRQVHRAIAGLEGVAAVKTYYILGTKSNDDRE